MLTKTLDQNVIVWRLRVVQCCSDKPGIFRCEQSAWCSTTYTRCASVLVVSEAAEDFEWYGLSEWARKLLCLISLYDTYGHLSRDVTSVGRWTAAADNDARRLTDRRTEDASELMPTTSFALSRMW